MNLAHADPVVANNPMGDAFTNPTTVNTGQAIGSSGWYYNNVRNQGVVGVDGTYGRNGNASVHMTGTVGPGGNSSKGDVEYLAGAVANASGNYVATGSLGSLSGLTEMHYDWYRSSTSTNEVSQHPSMRVFVDRDGNLATSNDRGYLIFESVYNGGATGTAVPTDAWVAQSIVGNTFLWSNNGFGAFSTDPNGGYPYDTTLAEWQSAMPSALIMGFSSGFGSGWGPFDGAVDNIGWTISGTTTNSNFELAGAAVPEPASMALVAAALTGLALTRRRKA